MELAVLQPAFFFFFFVLLVSCEHFPMSLNILLLGHHFLMAVWYSITWMHHNLFNHPVGPLSYFQFFALINKAVMSILVHKSLHPFQIASLGLKGYILLKVFDVYDHISWGCSFSPHPQDRKKLTEWNFHNHKILKLALLSQISSFVTLAVYLSCLVTEKSIHETRGYTFFRFFHSHKA